VGLGDAWWDCSAGIGADLERLPKVCCNSLCYHIAGGEKEVAGFPRLQLQRFKRRPARGACAPASRVFPTAPAIRAGVSASPKSSGLWHGAVREDRPVLSGLHRGRGLEWVDNGERPATESMTPRVPVGRR